MPNIYIHGAHATPETFNYIRKNIGKSDDIMISYSSVHSFKNNLKDMIQQIQYEKEITFIAHSLGGVYALYLANQFPKKVQQTLSMSTPYGGSSQSNLVKWLMPTNQLFKDIASHNPVIQGALTLPLPCPWTNIVSTRGHHPWLFESNDGVVTVASQKARPDMQLIDIHVNHYEIVISEKTMSIINRLIQT